MAEIEFHLDVSFSLVETVEVGDGDHDLEITTMMKPQCVLSRLAVCAFLFLWQIPLHDVPYFFSSTPFFHSVVMYTKCAHCIL